MDRRIVAATLLSIGLVACGSSSTSTPPAPTATARPTAAPTSSGGPTELNISVSTTGSFTESGSFQSAAFNNGTSAPCANFTAAAPQFSTHIQGTVAGQNFGWTIAVIPYAGPGTYSSSTSLPMQVSIGPSSDNTFQAPIGHDGPDQFTLTTAANGGGSFAFTNWPNQTTTGPGSKMLSGTIRWTCS